MPKQTKHKKFPHAYRSMIKWQSMFLSEHREALRSRQKNYGRVHPLALTSQQMTLTKLRQKLFLALNSQLPCTIVLNEVDSDGHYRLLHGYIHSLDHEYFLMNQETIPLSLLKSCQVILD
ncbi:YolD-like family protein [Aerococcus urinae]|uniref:YolD-like family protein n=1 Tax=Aerococcus urinae TaxID=1376 RepID=A0A120I9R1_9LACT|nr:YolD-like family protein [Aerococcus urinae]AMB95708.1 hypothetical protein AWM73_03940 [Aerococcus urinae]MCY3032829.1 YolD-like family protein [Aerococcus urinae]MCY3037509.1 YolD-like family protein [Aerococcus urinae]MCY3044876.1 YolD-like family protein [Aerococcus urinae]MCY3046473.1 YolD-like family protein [Aerococcus urinae]